MNNPYNLLRWKATILGIVESEEVIIFADTIINLSKEIKKRIGIEYPPSKLRSIFWKKTKKPLWLKIEKNSYSFIDDP